MSKNELNKIKTQEGKINDSYSYGPNTELNTQVFIAEYSSRRAEILQRIAQQTTLYQISITAFGVIIGYALEKIHPGSYNGVILISTYLFSFYAVFWMEI